jgi:phosphatidylglycerophosphate synthase
MESIKELRRKVAKSTVAHHPPRHDVVVRRISIYVTWLLLRTPLTANQVTLLQILVGSAGGILLIPADHAWNLLGIFLLQFGYVLDCSDGEVARYRGQSSVRGVFLDLIGHEIVVPLMYFGLAVGEFQRSGRFEVLFFGFAAALFSLRFDISAMFQVINTLFLKAENPSYDFETLQHITPARTSRLATGRPSIFRVIFRYPESMNLITILLIGDWLFPQLTPGNLSLIYIFLAVFGTLVPLARLYSIFRIFRDGEVEQRYAEIVQTVRRMTAGRSES